MNILSKVRVTCAAIVFASAVLGSTIIPASAQVAPAQPAVPQTYLEPTSITLRSNMPFATAGSSLTLSGVVSPNARGMVVVFDEAGNVLGQTFVSWRGTYQLTIPAYSANSLSVGLHTLTAQYNGNATFTPSVSAPITEVIYPHW